MQRLAANDVPRLVRRLGSGKQSSVDSARARLSVIGGRAVEDLVVALEDGNTRIRARVMPLLALITDPRGHEPLMAMLLDRNPRLRAIAAQSLARFPSRGTVAALNRLLERERATRVRIAAVQSLVELYAAGQEEAVRRVLELLTDPAQPAELRLSGFALLPVLKARERKTLLSRLLEDPDDEIRRRAESGTTDGRGIEARLDPAKKLLADLGSADYSVWSRAVKQLAAWGSAAAAPLIDAMQERSHDPEYCTRAGMALKAIGPRRARILAESLDRVDQPVPLLVLVDVVGAFGIKSMIYRLKDLIDRLEQRPPDCTGSGGPDLRRVCAKAHLELARIGSRVAIASLHDALVDGNGRIDLELVSAVERIGKRDEIGVLLRAYAREDPFVRERIAHAVRSIMKRERIRRNNRIFHVLSAQQQAALVEILPSRTPSRRSGRRPAVPRATD